MGIVAINRVDVNRRHVFHEPRILGKIENQAFRPLSSHPELRPDFMGQLPDFTKCLFRNKAAFALLSRLR